MKQLNGNINTFTYDAGKLYEILLFQCAVEFSGRFLRINVCALRLPKTRGDFT